MITKINSGLKPPQEEFVPEYKAAVLVLKNKPAFIKKAGVTV